MNISVIEEILENAYKDGALSSNEIKAVRALIDYSHELEQKQLPKNTCMCKNCVHFVYQQDIGGLIHFKCKRFNARLPDDDICGFCKWSIPKQELYDIQNKLMMKNLGVDLV